MVTITAKVVDSTHLELSTPIATREGETVLIAVAESADADRKDWLEASMSSLRCAYSDSEPDYAASMVKEVNPEYQT